MRMSNTLTVATCQFAVCDDIVKNYQAIRRQIIEAGSRNADIVHFCECSLSGYAGIDFPKIRRQDESILSDALDKIRALSKSLGTWIILGSHHFRPDENKPFNSLYVINDRGEIRDRYDKRYLTACRDEREIDHFSAGEKPVVFYIKGIPCGLLICHEWRYPELYREYYRMQVKILFQSWYDGNQSVEKYRHEGKFLGELITGSVRGYAANNHIWISGSNTCRKESSFPAFVVRPDGRYNGKLKRNRPGVLISHIDLQKEFPDPSGHLRDRVIKS